MNQKKCKALRRLARENTKEMPARVTYRHSRKGMVLNLPQSTRGLYRAMKRGVRAERVAG